MNWKRVAGWGILILVLGAAAYPVYQRASSLGEEASQQRGSRPVLVRVSDLQHGEMREMRRLSGSLYPRAEFLVAPKISGRLAELNVDIGDRVQRGQVIGRLDDDELSLAVEEVRAELAVSEANLAEAENAARVAEREFERILTLFERNSATEAALDTVRLSLDEARSRVRVATAQVTQREAAVRAAEVRLSQSNIIAAWNEGDRDRVVGARFTDEGSTLSANEAVVSVLDIDVLRAVIFVTERDYPRLSVGQKAVIRADAYPGEEFEGEIMRIAPLFDSSSRQARVEIRVPNPEHRLKAGMFVLAEIMLREIQDATIMHQDAIVRRNGSTGVFVVDEAEGKAVFREVRTGIRNGDWLEVLEPRDLNGPVVVLGQHMIEDGASVEIANADRGRSATVEGEGAIELEVMQ